ncbi:MAG: DUF1700 domain-containing protein [Clostridiales bacterium]|jgi:uncharacterized membrane protein|nr:DUF1700 domain-containing protein [Clostridiales bacterium]
MSRFDFMRKLEDLLLDIPIEERSEALKYYNDYFDDAGVDNEDNIISELGSPERIAGIIKADLHAEGDNSQNRGFFTEKGYKDTVYEETKYEVVKPDEVKQEESNKSATTGNTTSSNTSTNTGSSGSSNNKLALIILLCIFAIPVGIPLLIAFISVIFSLVITVFALLFGFGIAGIVMVPVGIATVFIGLINIGIPFMGLVLCGVGLLMLGLGILFVMFCVWLSKILIPAIIKGTVYIFRRPFQNRSVSA